MFYVEMAVGFFVAVYGFGVIGIEDGIEVKIYGFGSGD